MSIIEQYQDELSSSDRIVRLRERAQTLLVAGNTRSEILSAFTELGNELHEAGRYDDEDAVLEVMDFLVGWCSPHMQI